jgi:L-alanine-DL-glutamate epimerase-like enolase superfamily enzyme
VRIADIDVTTLCYEYPNRRGFVYGGGLVTGRVTSLIRVLTDSGLVGLGAAYSSPDLVRLIVERQFKPILVGEDVEDIERVWDTMYLLTRWYGRKGVAVSALGGIDIALWDLRGKALGRPLYRLLGGETNTVPAYASGLFWQDDLGLVEAEAAWHRRRGFTRVKTRVGRSWEYDVAALDAIRRGLGPDGEIMVDGSHRFTLATAERMARVLAAKGVFWFEEPFPPEDIDSYVALRPRIDVPLAAGENEFGVQGFRELFRAGAVDIAQPDACRAGGISECLRIARMAADANVRVATHTWSDAVALIANAHVVASLSNGVTVEVDQTGNPFVDDLLTRPLDIHNGLLHLSDAPGLGIELNQETVDRLTLLPDQPVPDGNYSDLFFGREYLVVPAPYAAATG